MRLTCQEWKTLAALPIAIPLIISTGFKWILTSWQSTEFRKSLDRPRTNSLNKPDLQMRWIAAKQNNNRKLRMPWTVPTKSELAPR